MHTFPRPAEPTLAAARRQTGHSCPSCGGSVQEYRVLGESGWWDVAKCADCLHSLRRTPAPYLGSFEPLVHRAEERDPQEVER